MAVRRDKKNIDGCWRADALSISNDNRVLPSSIRFSSRAIGDIVIDGPANTQRHWRLVTLARKQASH